MFAKRNIILALDYHPPSTSTWALYLHTILDNSSTIHPPHTQMPTMKRTLEVCVDNADEAARREMVVKLEDFLRRRSKIAQVVREEEIRAAPGLREACRILFGGGAEEKIAEYFGAVAPSRKRPATA